MAPLMVPLLMGPLLTVAFAVPARGQSDPAPERLIVVLDEENLPYSSRRGRPAGLDAEIATALAGWMNRELEIDWVDTLAEGLLSPLLGDESDAILAVGAPVDLNWVEEETAVGREVLFSIPYASTRYVLVTRRSSPEYVTFAQIDRIPVGVEVGSVAGRLLGDRGFLLRRFGSQDRILKALLDGRLDIGVVWTNSAWLIDQDAKMRERLRVQPAEPEIPGMAWNLAMAIAPDHASLLEEVNAAIMEMKREAVFERLFAGYKIPYLEPIEIGKGSDR